MFPGHLKIGIDRFQKLEEQRVGSSELYPSTGEPGRAERRHFGDLRR